MMDIENQPLANPTVITLAVNNHHWMLKLMEKVS